jgi:hypothetical protein
MPMEISIDPASTDSDRSVIVAYVKLTGTDGEAILGVLDMPISEQEYMELIRNTKP